NGDRWMYLPRAAVVAGLVCLVYPLQLFSQIRYVQSANNVSFSTGTSVSASFATNTTAGDTVIVSASTEGPPGPAIPSMVDTQGNIYAQAVALNGAAIWYAKSIVGGAA